VTPATPPSPPAGYLDSATAEPLHPAAGAVLAATYEQGWADPGRRYAAGRRARALLDGAREQVAAVLGCRPDGVAFLPSGSVALHAAVRGVLAVPRARPRLATGAVEHSAVLHAAVEAAARGVAVTRVPVDGVGRIDLAAWRETVAGGLAAGLGAAGLACLQTANHEVGTRQPLAEAYAACREAGVPLLVDAAQTAGREPVPASWDLLAASARKWGGPAGVGILAVRPGVRCDPLLAPDGRESGRWPGAVALPAVLAAATALEASAREAAVESPRLRALTDRIRAAFAAVPDAVVLGDPDDRLPHIAAASLLYAAGESLVDALDREGFAVSSGSSCSSDVLEPSHVLVAMGVLTHGNLRVSLPRGAADGDVERFCALLPRVVAAARAGLGAEGL
jgi:cysteine desulfurase